MNKESSPATQLCAKQVAYLAGPMRGYSEYNFPAFHAAAAKLRGHGLDVWSPAEHDVNEDGFDPAKDTHQPMRHYMRRDLPAVLDADMVCVLPGWEKSQGACLEVHVAQTCGIPVYVAETMQPIPSKPSETARTEWEGYPGIAHDLESLRIAAARISDAYHTDPGTSDLDNEQPIHISTTLGDWRALNFALLALRSPRSAIGTTADAKDAARYRFLRHDSTEAEIEKRKATIVEIYQGTAMDEQIDKMMVAK